MRPRTIVIAIRMANSCMANRVRALRLTLTRPQQIAVMLSSTIASPGDAGAYFLPDVVLGSPSLLAAATVTRLRVSPAADGRAGCDLGSGAATSESLCRSCGSWLPAPRVHQYFFARQRPKLMYPWRPERLTESLPRRPNAQRTPKELKEQHMRNRRDFVKTVVGATAGLMAGHGLVDGLGLTQAQAQTPQGATPPTRREVRVAGKRVKVVDVHAHATIPAVGDVVKDTPLERNAGGGGRPRTGSYSRIG